MLKSYKQELTFVLFSFVSLSFVSGFILSSSFVSAEDSAVDEINIIVPSSCNLTSTGNESHHTTINNGTYASDIGTTTIKAFCNDQEGFAIYAIGYTDDTDGKNVLTNATLGSTHDIATGTGTSGNSQWAMKLSTQTSPEPAYPITIQNSFDNYHTVPDDYTLVAKRTASTDTGTNATGSTLTSTYQVYISQTQSAGTYTGQVKYVMVHPNNYVAGQYSIAYNANGGSGTMTGHTNVNNYEPVTLSNSTFTAPAGYEFAGWCTVQDQTQNPQTTCNGSLYQPGDEATSLGTSNSTATLYAIWSPICTSSGTTISTISCMQDITSSNKSSVMNSMTQNAQYQLRDVRDGKSYYVAKLADGNIWMTQNLDLDLSTSTTLTPANTDIPANWTPSTSTYTSVDSWVYSEFTIPESYDPGNLYWNGILDSDHVAWNNYFSSWNENTGEFNEDLYPLPYFTSNAGDLHYHLGNYYNWNAAVAMNNSSSYTANNVDVNQSICPVGWMLPKDGPNFTGSGSLYYLVNTLNLTAGTNGSGNLQNSPVYFVYGGGVWDDGFINVGGFGLYLSSVTNYQYDVYNLYFNVDGSLNSTYDYIRRNGFFIRCLVR